MWSIEKMLNRAFFDSIVNRLSTFFNVLKPATLSGAGSPRKYSSKPETLHRVLSEEFLKKFDEVVIIGDIHGCYDEFMLLIEKMASRGSIKVDQKRLDYNLKKSYPADHFLNTRILKICAGDLVNKGPKSKEVLDYMMANADNCIAVRGNHDEVVIREFLKHLDGTELPEKNKWMMQLNKSHLNYLSQLPYTIALPSLNVTIVHAGLVPNLPLENQEVQHMVSMRNLIESKADDNQTIAYEATSSGKNGQPWASLWKGPMHIYFGHDAARRLQEYPFATGLDTGVVYGGSLTAKFVMGPRKGEYLAMKALQTWKDPFAEKTA